MLQNSQRYKNQEFKNQIFKGNHFKGITFENCKFDNVNFENCQIDDIYFDNCNIYGLTINNCVCWRFNINCWQSNCSALYFKNTDFSSSDTYFWGINGYTEFEYCLFNSPNFRKCNLGATNITISYFIGTMRTDSVCDVGNLDFNFCYSTNENFMNQFQWDNAINSNLLLKEHKFYKATTSTERNILFYDLLKKYKLDGNHVYYINSLKNY